MTIIWMKVNLTQIATLNIIHHSVTISHFVHVLNGNSCLVELDIGEIAFCCGRGEENFV